MSAAIQALGDGRTVGIDRPTPTYARELSRTVLAERPSATVVGKILSNTVSATTHALTCRLAAAVATRTGVRLEVDAPTPHAVDRSAAPAAQARDEETQVRRSRAFANAFAGASTTRASELGDAARERHMADRLASLARTDSVVAVVGMDHLEAIVDETATAVAAEAQAGVEEHGGTGHRDEKQGVAANGGAGHDDDEHRSADTGGVERDRTR